MVLFAAFLLCYLLSADAFDAPLLAPFSPLTPCDLRDSAVKYNLFTLRTRPKFLRPKNVTRLRPSKQKRKTPPLAKLATPTEKGDNE